MVLALQLYKQLNKLKGKGFTILIGIAMGAVHASGTAKAMEIGETEGGMASLVIGVAGLLGVLITPYSNI